VKRKAFYSVSIEVSAKLRETENGFQRVSSAIVAAWRILSKIRVLKMECITRCIRIKEAAGAVNRVMILTRVMHKVKA